MPTVVNDGLEIHYETRGPSDAAAVAFVEGWGLGRWMWRWQADAVADAYQAILPDNRGTGNSETPRGPSTPTELAVGETARFWSNCLSAVWPRRLVEPWTAWTRRFERPFTVSCMAGDLDAVLADRGVERAHVVGASLGGMIALQYALDYDRAATLTLLAATPGWRSGPGVTRAFQERLLDPPRHGSRRERLRSRLRHSLNPEFVADNPGLVERIVDWRLDADASHEGRLQQAAAASTFDVGDRLDEIAVPVHVVHGTDDRVLPVGNGEYLHDNLPNSTFTRIAGGSHLFFVEEPDFVNRRLLAFLDEHGT
jgi:pimeloyl-ACP methyl ester carboxylesterase